MSKSKKKQQEDLQVRTVNNVLVVSTLDMYEGLNVEHKAILQLVKKYETEFQDIRTFTFEMSKSGGRPTTFCYLDEEQTTFLITLMKNSEYVVPFKRKLTKEFYKMRRFIAQQMNMKANAEYIEARQQGKLIRRTETDTIKDFVEYATAQGSQNAKMYYSNISRMQNQALFLFDQKYKNLREILDINQLSIVKIADKIVSKAIQEGMAQGLHYREIYQMVKSRIETFATLHGKSSIPQFGERLAIAR